jgi:hypothetical protein
MRKLILLLMATMLLCDGVRSLYRILHDRRVRGHVVAQSGGNDNHRESSRSVPTAISEQAAAGLALKSMSAFGGKADMA